MTNAEDIRRVTEARGRQRSEMQTAQARNTLQNAIGALLTSLQELAHRIAGNRGQSNTADAKQKDWASQHPEFTNSESTESSSAASGSSQPSASPAFLMSTAIFLLLIYPAVYWLDVFLLSGNAKQIAKDFAQGNQTLIYSAIFAVPLMILLTEAYFQTQWSVAQTRGQLLLWGTAAVAMCVAIPAAIVGFSMATSVNSGGVRSAQVQNWHLFGKAALAFFAHFAILLGGRRLHEAKNYVIFKFQDRLLERRINRFAHQIQIDEAALTSTFTDYFRQLNDFNAVYVGQGIEPGPFDEITRSEINRVFGYEIIAAPHNQNPATADKNNDGGSGNNDSGAATNNPPPNPINPNQNNQPNGFGFDMDGEDEVRP